MNKLITLVIFACLLIAGVLGVFMHQAKFYNPNYENWTNVYFINDTNEEVIEDIISGNNLSYVGDGLGHNCWFSLFNSSIKSNQERSVIIEAKRFGDGDNSHSDLFGMGVAKTNQRFALRSQNTSEGGKWMIEGNEWSKYPTNYSTDTNKNFFFIQYNGSSLKMWINGFNVLDTLTTFGTKEAPISVGCAYFTNSSPVVFFNGKIDKVMISNKSVSYSEAMKFYKLCSDCDSVKK